MGLSNYSQATVSINRMLSFFQLEELVDYVDTDSDGDVVISMENANLSWILKEKEKEKENSFKPDNSLPIAVSKSKADVASSTNGNKNKEEDVGEELLTIELQDESNLVPRVNRSIETLSDMNFSIKRGELVAIVGSVGSGKSSLLSSLLGELNLISGHVRMSGSIAYCVRIHILYHLIVHKLNSTKFKQYIYIYKYIYIFIRLIFLCLFLSLFFNI